YQLAEGSVYAPFLPVNDKGHKGGSASFRPQPDATPSISRRIPSEIKPDPRRPGETTWHEFEYPEELGTWPDHATQTVLAAHSLIVGHVQGLEQRLLNHRISLRSEEH